MAKIDGVQEITIDLLRPYSNNAKIHGEEQVQQIADSIKEFGFISPCLIDRDYNLIAGHGRLMAAQKLGMEKVPCVFVEGLTETQRKAYILADNRLTELGEWNRDLVSEELMSLQSSGFDIDLTGFNIDDISITDDMGEYYTDEDFAQDASGVEPRIRRGEVWQLGRHTLMCGDSTVKADVHKLVGDEVIDLLVTDPPYNVSLGTDSGHPVRPGEMKARKRRTDGKVIENDSWEDDDAFIEFLTTAFINARDVMKEGASFYIWYASTQSYNFLTALKEADLTLRQTLIRVKNALALGRQDYQWRHEPCMYGWKDGAGHYFIDLRSQDTVMNVPNIDSLSASELRDLYKELASFTTAMVEDKPTRSDDHPTMKPLYLIKKQVRNSSRENETVLDLFGGSGTTLLACEELNRTCYMMEYDPNYAEVIIRRWEELTGEKAKPIVEGNK